VIAMGWLWPFKKRAAQDADAARVLRVELERNVSAAQSGGLWSREIAEVLEHFAERARVADVVSRGVA
jgi:hypothetical protein